MGKILPLIILVIVALAVFPACDSGSQPTASESAAPDRSPAGSTPPAAAAEPAAAAGTTSAEDQIPVVEESDQPVAATVNGVPISRQTLEGQVAMAESGRLAQGGEESKSVEEQRAANLEMRVEVLNSLVNLELACQEALRRGYAPTESELDAAMKNLADEFGEPDAMYQALEQFGATENDLKGQLAKNLALQKWQENDFLARIKVTDEEAQAFYDAHPNLVQHGDMVRVSQIFISVPLGSLDNVRKQAKAKAEKALNRLRTGDDFGIVAAEMSNDPEAAKTKGDLGWLSKGQYLPMFEETFFSLEPGQTSTVIESPMGFHIFKVTGTKPAGQESFENMKVDIVEFLSSGKLAEAVREKMVELHREADIQILDPALKKAYDAYEAAEAAAIAATKGAEPVAGQTGASPE